MPQSKDKFINYFQTPENDHFNLGGMICSNLVVSETYSDPTKKQNKILLLHTEVNSAENTLLKYNIESLMEKLINKLRRAAN